MIPNARYLFASALSVLGCVSVLVAYARIISCAWCRSSWAIYPRAVGDLCRSCSAVFDKNRVRAGGRRSLLRRIFRTAA